MNLIFLRNVVSILFLVAFVLDIIFGNGVNWRDWICGAAFFFSVNDLMSSFKKYVSERKVYPFGLKLLQNVTSVLVIVTFALSFVFGKSWHWFDWFIGAGFALAIHTLVMNHGGRSRR